MIGFQKAHRPRGERRRDELGASLVEYALLLSLIAVVCFGAVSYFGRSNDTGLNKSQDCMTAAYSGQALPENC